MCWWRYTRLTTSSGAIAVSMETRAGLYVCMQSGAAV
jgi:hypothetical protein